jgi:hypothetical protein
VIATHWSNFVTPDNPQGFNPKQLAEMEGMTPEQKEAKIKKILARRERCEREKVNDELREKHLVKRREYNAKNREKQREYNAKRDREKQREYNAKRDREKRREENRKYRARKKAEKLAAQGSAPQ